MGATLTTADSALKEDYQPGIRNQLNNDIMMLAQVGKNTEDFEGRRAVLALNVTRNSGVGARRESGTDTLPTAGNQGYAEERISVRGNYGRIQITGWLIEGTRSDSGSFQRELKGEMNGMVRDLKRDINRQVFGTSDGVIATCGTTTATTVVQLATTTTAVQMRQFEVGMTVDIGTVAQLLAGSGGRVYGSAITAVDATNKTITISSSVTTAGTDFVARAGSGGSQRELTGLQTIVDSTGTVFNVNPSTYPSWSSYEDSNSGTNRQITELLVEKAIHNIHLNSGTDPDFIVCSDGVYRSYANVLLGQKRFSDITLAGGHKALSINAGGGDLALKWDRDCPSNQMFILNTKQLIEFVYCDWSWMEKDGAVLSRVANNHAYEATFFKLHELATDFRAAHGKIVDITES